MFEKSLTDLIRGIRSNKKNEREYILKCIEEIRKELKTDDMDYKAAAISKLTYLQMFGYDFSWAAFHVVEVMSSPNLMYKRIGYLAGSQSFRQDTEVLMLATNQLKKDLSSPRYLEVGIAINGLSQFLTPDLAQFLCQDLLNLLSHSRGYIRKRAVLALYKVFLKFPEGLRICFPKLKEKLDDPDPSVVTSAVNVICELSRKTPQNYLSLVPTLYKLLTTSNNNWMLIKVVKLFASLTPLEPRLIKKLVQPLTNLIETTPAMSLLYECIYTVITGGFLNPQDDSGSSLKLATMCSDKLKSFLQDQDQNLKYIGLLALDKLALLYPDLAGQHGELVLACVDDFDYSVRIRAVDLLSKLVTKNSLISTVKKLMDQLVGEDMDTIHSPQPITANPNPVPSYQFSSDPSYRKKVVTTIVDMCSRNSYQNVSNFEWYLATLLDLVYVAKADVGDLLRTQVLDVAVRVRSVRGYAVKLMTRLIFDTTLIDNAHLPETNSAVLKSAAWIVGEYSNFLLTPGLMLKSLFHSGVIQLDFDCQAIYLQSSIKLLAAHAQSFDLDRNLTSLPVDLKEALDAFKKDVKPFIGSINLEVQERASNIFELVSMLVEYLEMSPGEAKAVFDQLTGLFLAYELNAVAPKAQSKVPVPEGLDLDTWIGAPPSEVQLPSFSTTTLPENDDDSLFNELSNSGKTKKGKKSKEIMDDGKEDKAKALRKAQRKQRIKNDPFYIAQTSSDDDEQQLLPEVDAIPIVPLNIASNQLSLKSMGLESFRLGQQVKGGVITSDGIAPVAVVDSGEMPEGAEDSEPEKDVINKRDKAIDLLDVDLITPLKDDEKLPQIQQYKNPNAHLLDQPKPVKNKKSKKSGKTKKKKEKEATKAEENEISLMEFDPISNTIEAGKKEKVSKKKRTKKIEKSENVEDETDLLGLDLPTTPLPILRFQSLTPSEPLSIELVNNQHISVHATILSSNTSSVLPVQFQIQVPETGVALSDAELVFLDSNGVKVNGLDLWNTIKVTSSLEPGREVAKTMDMHVDTDSEVRVEGMVGYVVENQFGTRSTSNFTLNIPTIAFYKSPPPISPPQFQQLLEHSQFASTSITTLEIPLARPVSITNAQQLVNEVLESLFKQLRAEIVEKVDGMAYSFITQKINEDWIVGLVKHEIDGATDKLILKLEVKSGDQNHANAYVQIVRKLVDMLQFN